MVFDFILWVLCLSLGKSGGAGGGGIGSKKGFGRLRSSVSTIHQVVVGGEWLVVAGHGGMVGMAEMVGIWWLVLAGKGGMMKMVRMSSTGGKGGNGGNGEMAGFRWCVVMCGGGQRVSCGIGGTAGIAGDEWCAMVGMKAAIWAGE